MTSDTKPDYLTSGKKAGKMGISIMLILTPQSDLDDVLFALIVYKLLSDVEMPWIISDDFNNYQ